MTPKDSLTGRIHKSPQMVPVSATWIQFTSPSSLVLSANLRFRIHIGHFALGFRTNICVYVSSRPCIPHSSLQKHINNWHIPPGISRFEVLQKFANVSEEHTASIFRVEERAKQVTNKQKTASCFVLLASLTLDDVTYQKIVPFFVFVRTPNLID
jgi:hypothetical protein